MVVILKSLGAKSVLARPQERLLAQSHPHYITILWIGVCLLAIPAILLATVLIAGIFNADFVYVIGVLVTLPLLWFVINYATFAFREILVTDRSIYRIRWGRVGWRWGITQFTEIPLESVVSLLLKQNLFTRAFGYGEISVRLNVAPENIVLKYVPYPQIFGGVIQRALLVLPQLPPITEADVQDADTELQTLYDRQLITQAELDVSRRDLLDKEGAEIAPAAS